MIEIDCAQRLEYLRWIERKVDCHLHPAATITFLRGGAIVACAAYTNMRDGNIELTVASDTPLWLNRRTLRAIFAYPFLQLQMRRVTAIVAKRNRRSRSITERSGFRLEGMVREGFRGDDACLYGMLRRECRWIDIDEKLTLSADAA